jgi:uncharacterized alpha-E superfamily protein
MLSRIADSLFWLNRYTERADSLLRVMYVHYILSLDRSVNREGNWLPVLQLYSSLNHEFTNSIAQETAESLKHLLIDDSNSNSLKSMVSKARENARGAQDHITKEVWEVINLMYHQANNSSLSSKLQTEQAIKIIESFTKQTALFSGITDNTMSRGLGWNFMNLGKFIERCQQTISITNSELQKQRNQPSVNGDDILQWRSLLLALSGYEMHLKTYRGADISRNVLHQVTLNENFPRSIIYSLTRIRYYVENIMTVHEDQKKDLLHSIGRLYSKIQYMDLAKMNQSELQSFLWEAQNDLAAFTTQLGNYYFSYS